MKPCGHAAAVDFVENQKQVSHKLHRRLDNFLEHRQKVAHMTTRPAAVLRSRQNSQTKKTKFAKRVVSISPAPKTFQKGSP